MAKGNSDEFDIGSVVMRVVFSLAIVFLTFNPTGHSYYHWLQQNLTPVQPVVVIAGILLLGAWLFFIRSTFSSMGTIGVVLLLALFAAIIWWMVAAGLALDGRQVDDGLGGAELPRPAARHRHVVGAHPRAHFGPGVGRPRRPVAVAPARQGIPMSSDAPPADRYPSQPSHVTALDLPLPPRESLPPDLQKYFRICDEKIGFLPNVLAAYSFDEKKLRAFIGFYNELMLEDSPLSKLEREMIAVVVSSANRCYYCQVAHGQAVRELSGDPALGELLVMNYRAAALTPRQRAMLDFAHKMTVTPDAIVDDGSCRAADAGFDDRSIWDIASVAAFFNMTNRMATAIDMMPNPEYHAKSR